LVDPYFTLHAAAWYQHWGQFWPKPYWPGRDQAYRLAVADRAEWTAGRTATRPPSPKGDDEPARSHGPGEKAASRPFSRARSRAKPARRRAAPSPCRRAP